ncbi:hypothetical protein ACXYMO_01050 [Arenibacterium sp. CAU 1754]
MPDEITIENPPWPPEPYSHDSWPDAWLRFENEYPGSGRPSRLVGHADVPYEVTIQSDSTPDAAVLGAVASNYLRRLKDFLKNRNDLDLPKGWPPHKNGSPNADVWRWLPVWPPVGGDDVGDKPRIASWNLSRNTASYALPATIVMVAAEVILTDVVLSPNIGLRVPMSVTATDDGYKVAIRSMTAELPKAGYRSYSEIVSLEPDDPAYVPINILTDLIGQISGGARNEILASSANVDPDTISFDEYRFPDAEVSPQSEETSALKVVFKAQGAGTRYPEPLSYQVVSKFTVRANGSEPLPPSSETCALVTHAGVGEADIFLQTPPGWFDPAEPDAEYDWMQRQPFRDDDVLKRYRVLQPVGNSEVSTLMNPGFKVRLCPEYVPQDKRPLGNTEKVKKIKLPAGNDLTPRSDEFSAVSAYVYSQNFFDLLASYGIDPETYVVRAKTDIQIFYRYGIYPGPGRDGKTINAQVAFDCKKTDTLPQIRMNLALANLNRWKRPKLPNGKWGLPEPLGIASSRRWILHEFGHYLLAARIGKLEFDFAHSPGDAMAAVCFDVDSRLADQRGGVAETFRGVTYPFVFSTRRHDRTPLLGWAWYGTLNRSVIQNPPSDCDQLKGYLTEQILSSTVFRLYRVLGGDTMAGAEPDRYIRQRASFMTLFLLIRAIAGLAQSPSTAEMLELGMEDVGLLMVDDLEMVPQPMMPPGLTPRDVWQGSVTHKAVRWAYEAQGMFPADRTVTDNGIGQAPRVDIYLKDRRPEAEQTVGGTVQYGPGAYTPVSLDWSAGAQWQMAEGRPVVGNRGSERASQIAYRFWIGLLSGDPTDDWGLTSDIEWIHAGTLSGDPDLDPDTTGHLSEAAIVKKIEESAPAGGASLVVLIEASCPDDRANTDPLANLAVAVRNGAGGLKDLPKTARRLTDLVANDNNLGLRVVRF